MRGKSRIKWRRRCVFCAGWWQGRPTTTRRPSTWRPRGASGAISYSSWAPKKVGKYCNKVYLSNLNAQWDVLCHHSRSKVLGLEFLGIHIRCALVRRGRRICSGESQPCILPTARKRAARTSSGRRPSHNDCKMVASWHSWSQNSPLLSPPQSTERP